MPAQLQLNQGPQDALLFDNSKSMFTNVGYTRTSNYQMELRDVDAQNTPNLGSTVTFVIPKSADLLGPVDLLVEFDKATNSPTTGFWGWVDNIGYAMIEKLTLQVGNTDVEVLTGDQLNIMNELMKSDRDRLSFEQIGKTGRPLVDHDRASGATTTVARDTKSKHGSRVIAGPSSLKKDGMKLIIPLSFFFTSHPSKYFPLCAIAGCNDVRIQIKFRPLSDLLVSSAPLTVTAGGELTGSYVAAADDAKPVFSGQTAFVSNEGCKLRCHYYHLCGPEASSLMNKEQCRLMKLWEGNTITERKMITCSGSGHSKTYDFELNFLHPVQEIIVTIRKVSDMSSGTASIAGGAEGSTNNVAPTKSALAPVNKRNYFAYHGGGSDPNLESIEHASLTAAAKLQAHASTKKAVNRESHILMESIQLKLNGQSRHLDGNGVDRDYLMNRLMPLMHSNTSTTYLELAEYANAPTTQQGTGTVEQMTSENLNKMMLYEAAMRDRKEIYSIPFAMYPEGPNPTGSVNFSKVSHAKLSIALNGVLPLATTQVDDEYQFDIYGVYYNWAAIKDGRVTLSFA